MTRARLIERVIAEWLEGDGWVTENETGAAEKSRYLNGERLAEEISIPSLASALDAELDRIIWETSK